MIIPEHHMKKIITIGLFAALSLSGCKSKLEDLYTNPEQTTNPSIEKFFTQMLNNDRIFPKYWDMRTFQLTQTGVFSQASSYYNDLKRYQLQPYTDERWQNYYTSGGNGSGIVSHYREIERAYASLSAEDKKKADIFVQAAKIVYLDQTAQVVDMWGDIPFSEAGKLNLTGGEVIKPKYDAQKDVYEAVIKGLGEAAAYFATATGTTTFAKQDILLSGDVKKWQRLANSLRLRALMRISFVDEARARTDVMAMLNDPTTYPLLETENALLQPLTNYTGSLLNAFTEGASYVAPYYLLESVLKPANDPRIPVMYDKYGRTENGKWIANTSYNALPLSMTSNDQNTNVSKGAYAIVDSATFLNNSKLPGVVFSSAETNFLKAEAFERWGSSATAEAAYNLGVKQSVNYYYMLNNVSNTGRKETAPASAAIDAWIASSVKYTGSSSDKLAQIWTQKWVQFGFMQTIQSWAEYRRTKFPKLTFVPDTNPGTELPPSRLLYPAQERTLNADNYKAVSGQDKLTNKIFWDVK